MWDTVTWQRRGVRTLDATDAVYENKQVLDTVKDDTPISVDQTVALLRHFAMVSNKPRLAAMVTVVALSLDNLGVETYADMRRVTTAMYIEDCGVRKLDAQLLVAHFSRRETVELCGDAPEGGATMTQHDVVNLGPEGAGRLTANDATSHAGSGVDPSEDRTLEDDRGDIYD